MNDELNEIKNLYGEDMVNLCTKLFPTLLKIPGLLLSILKDNIAPTKQLASDIIKNNLYSGFKKWVYGWVSCFVYIDGDKIAPIDKTPFELMDKAGYNLYACAPGKDIDAFKKYYAVGEALRLHYSKKLWDSYIFIAVKKNVDEIRREDFKNPDRQDEYATSVLCIQIAAESLKVLAIKNRYNSTVPDHDSTFSKNLDNIVPGLTASFNRYFADYPLNKQFKNKFLHEKLLYKRANDGKYYRYHLETSDTYFCDNNLLIKNGKLVDTYTKEMDRYIFADNFVFDLQEKKMINLDDQYEDAFVESINSLGKIKNIVVSNIDDNRMIVIEYEDGRKVEVITDQHGSIIGYRNDYIESIGDNFLIHNNSLAALSLPNVKTIGCKFLWNNEHLKSLSLPSVETIDSGFLTWNNIITSLSLPKVEIIENDFLKFNNSLPTLSLPCVETIGDYFLSCNKKLTDLSVPNATLIGDFCLTENLSLKSLSLPNIMSIGKKFLTDNEHFVTIIPSQETRILGDGFMPLYCGPDYWYGIVTKEYNGGEDEIGHGSQHR